ncbi:MAG: hypothetical protein KatS3mg031_0521 [Chitinophagales bacterium]|nr:MAG: hypothetical protein KatS3mg031_0521 [Chitinophagales bacterium]
MHTYGLVFLPMFVLLLSLTPGQAQVVAGFSANITSGCAPLRVEFINTSSNSIEWDWDFGDGTSSVDKNPVHYYHAPGVYTVVLTAYGGGVSDTETKVGYITVYGFQVHASITAASCGLTNGTIDLTITGATPPIHFSWSTGAFSEDIANLSPGVYRVTITDSSGCQFTESYQVASVNGLTLTGTITAVSATGANDGAIQLTVHGGTGPYSYAWNPGGFTTKDISGLTAGVYCVTVTDAAGCAADKCFHVETAASGCSGFTVSGAVSHASGSFLHNGRIELQVSGGPPPYTYSWSNGATTRIVDGLTPGTYCVTVSDAGGCLKDTCFQVTTQSHCSSLSLSGTVTAVSVPGQNDGAVVLTVVGGTSPYSYSWSNGATTKNISHLSPGQYCVIVTDALGCTRDQCFLVEVSNPCGSFQVAAQITPAVCGTASGSVNLIVTGGTSPYFFAWSNGATTEDVYNLSAGNYRVTVEDGGNCRFSETYIIHNTNNNLSLTSSLTHVSVAGGTDGAIDLTVTGGMPPYSYQWLHGASTEDLSGLEAGRYCVLVTDASGCVEDGCFDVEAPNGSGCGDLAITGNVGHVPCGDSLGYINITVQLGTPPYFYHWSNGSTSEDLIPIRPGSYTVTVEDNGSCRKVETFVVGYGGGFQINGLVSPALAGTATGSVVLSITGGTPPYQFQWSNGNTNQNIHNLSPGQYCVIVTDSNGCKEDKCFSVGITGGCGDFMVTAYDDIILCEPGTFTLEANAFHGKLPYSFSWSPSAPLNTPGSRVTQGNISSTTTFVVTATDDNGCIATDTVHVFVLSAGNSSGVAFDSVTICRGDSLQLAAFGGTQYFWDPAAGLTDRNSPTPWASPLESKTYTVTIRNGVCESRFTVHVGVDDDCVWPGDANHDGIANNLDVLAIGIGFNISGLPRPNASIQWYGQYCPDWLLALASGPNLKHADCDGNGVINNADTLPIRLHYGLTHNKSGGPGKKFTDPELYFRMPVDTALSGQEVQVPVYLGTDSLPVNNFYGIAFSVHYDPTLIQENSMRFTPVNSFIGNPSDLLSFDIDIYGQARMDVGLTRTNRISTGGYGQIGTVSFTMKDDISGKDFLVKELILSFSGVRAIDNNENDLLLYYEPASLFVKMEITGVGASADNHPQVSVYPIPSTGNLVVELGDTEPLMLALLDMLGQEVFKIHHPDKIQIMKLEGLQNGLYFLKVHTSSGSIAKPVILAK